MIKVRFEKFVISKWDDLEAKLGDLAAGGKLPNWNTLVPEGERFTLLDENNEVVAEGEWVEEALVEIEKN